MSKLPLHPAIFMPAYFLSFPGALFIGRYLESPLTGMIGAVLLPSILQLLWTFQALTFLSPRSEIARRFFRVLPYLSLLFGIVVVYALAYDGYVRPYIGTTLALFVGRYSPFVGAIGLFPILATFWFAARATCEVGHGERGTFMTFALFVYLPLCAPFIYGTLKRIGRESDSGPRLASLASHAG